LVAPGTSATVDIERIAQPTSGTSWLMAQVFQGGWTSRFYTVEARKFAGYDGNVSNGLPGEGVIIHSVDVTRGDRRSQVVDVDGNGNPNDAGAIWLPGETFTDAANGITIRVISASGTTYRVEITDSSTATPHIVTNTNDQGPGSLRNALYWMEYFPQPILFRIPDTDPNFDGRTFTIPLLSQLPVVTWGQITVDGATQTAFTGDTNPFGPEIVLSGVSAGGYSQGLQIEAPQVTVRNLVIQNFSQSGIWLRGANAQNNVIEGCYLGTTADGTASAPNGWAGMSITDGAAGTRVGGTLSAQRNVLAGNGAYGIYIYGADCANIVVQGNRIGTNAAGDVGLGVQWGGVSVFGGAHDVMIGGSAAGAGNLISGNTSPGVPIADAGFNVVVQGNRIGTDITGTAAIPNGWAGVALWGGAHDNVVRDNLLSGNQSVGLTMRDPATQNNRVLGNLIGTDITGTVALANGWGGIEFWNGTHHNTVGGSTALDRNIISGNTQNGVAILNSAENQTRSNVVIGNYIGTNKAGTAAIGNTTGVGIWGGADDNLIGLPEPGKGNLIAGNSSIGVGIWHNGTTGNRVRNNLIGTNASGTAAIPNGWSGVGIQTGANGNFIGGAGASEGNLISGNGSYGIAMGNADSNGNVPNNNVVWGNRIGIDLNSSPLANGWANVAIFTGAHHNRIGGIAPGEGNIIAHSPHEGIWIGGNNGGVPGVGNTIRGNSIYGSVWLGIDLSGGTQIGWNVSTNDAGDGDSGPNNVQNFPVLTSATFASGTTTISGSLNSTANTQFAIDFYRADTAHASGNGSGAQYIGSLNVTTNGAGNASFAYAAPNSGPLFTGTATNLTTGDTSEFSPNVSLSNLATVSGTIILQNCPTTGVPIELRFTLPSGSFTRTVVLNAAGTYTVGGIPKASYTVGIKGSKWLRKNVAVNTTGGNVSGVNATLRGGDANNNNAVDISDLLLLIGSYNQVRYVGSYSEACDFNNDGANDITDLLLLVGNYNQLGDN
jgi:hypothetical protein